MTLICAALIISYFMITEVFKPVLKYNCWKTRRDYEEELKYYRLKVVKEFYPVLQKYSLSEIEERYGLNNVYETVGRAYLHRR